MTPAGFPHSEIHGSMPAFGYPWLFADRCVLRRLPVPRHPPCALLSLTCQYLFRYCLCQSCSNHFFWVLLHSHTLQFNVSVLFCLFRETIACFSGFTFFRFFFIQFSRYTCGGRFAPSLLLSTLVRTAHLSLCRGFPRTCGGRFAPFLLLSAWVRSPPLLAVPSGFGLLFSVILITAYNPRELPPAQPVVGSSGLEPPTSRLSGVRSNHLSYEPISVAVRGLAIYRPTCVFALNSFFPLSPLPEIRRLHRVPAI